MSRWIRYARTKRYQASRLALAGFLNWRLVKVKHVFPIRSQIAVNIVAEATSHSAIIMALKFNFPKLSQLLA